MPARFKIKSLGQCTYDSPIAVDGHHTGKYFKGENDRILVYVPMVQATSGRKQVDPSGDLWLSVLEATGQPSFCKSFLDDRECFAGQVEKLFVGNSLAVAP